MPNEEKTFGECDCPPEKLSTIPAAAKALEIPASTLRRAAKRGEIAIYRFGGLNRVRLTEVIAIINATRTGGQS